MPAVFCKQNNLCPKYFSLRRKQLATAAGKKKAGFVRVNVKLETKPDVAGAMASALIIHSNAGKLVFGTCRNQDGWHNCSGIWHDPVG